MATDVNEINDSSKTWESALVSEKANALSAADNQDHTTSSENIFDQNFIVVNNNGDINLEGLDPSLLKCVKEVLEDLERQQSSSQGTSNGDSEPVTTYIINLSNFEEPNVSCSRKETSSDNVVMQNYSESKSEENKTSGETDLNTPNISVEQNITLLDNPDRKDGSPSVFKSETTIKTSSITSKIKTLPFAGTSVTQSSQHSTTELDTKMSGKIIQPSVVVEDSALSDPVVTVYVTSSDQVPDTVKSSSTITVLSSTESADNLEDKSPVRNIQSLEHKLSGIYSNDSSCDSFPSTTSSVSESMLYKCSECEYSSHNKHYYKQHVDLVHREDRPYKCPHCDYAGKRRHALLEHMVVHSNQRPFICGHCNASFRKKGHLTNHIKLHTSQKLVHCGVCNIQLPDTEAFETHLRKIHNTDRLFKCKLCDHTVIDREVMLRHLQTHNEASVYSCPNCDCVLESEESLISHMTNVHNFHLVKGAEGKQNGLKVDESVKSNSEIIKPSTPLITNMMCSECGFICSSSEIMQKHMWIHIKKKACKQEFMNSNIVNPSSDTLVAPSTTLGVLKMNVDSGKKTLPKDVVYQCTSCSFTSSDNSAFIKHMLAHKTQQRVTSVDQSKLEDSTSERGVVTSSKPQSRSAGYLTKQESQEQKQNESSVPFIYDKEAARYRCIICGYHCEYQRTIKAHIWKHSGHQNIEYPIFDQTSTTNIKPASTLIQALVNKVNPKDDYSKGAPPVNSVHHTLPNVPGNSVNLFPVNMLSKGENIQLKDMKGLLPSEIWKATSASRLLGNIASSSLKSESKSSINCSGSTNNSFVHSFNRETSQIHVISSADVSQTFSPASFKLSSVKDESPLVSTIKNELYEQGESMSSIDEGFTEPSVVVEVMDTVSSESGLTGMASQHGSPRILDLDGSSGETKLIKALGNEDKTWKKSLIKTEADNLPIQAPEESFSETKSQKSFSAQLRCPISDHQVQDIHTHLPLCKQNIKTKHLQESQLVQTEMDVGHAEDTDSAESSDELSSSGGLCQQQKSGICSSLLAVIEQLRERSRSESEEDRQGESPVKKSEIKKNCPTELDMDSVDELQNIEKIFESGSEKFRCSLCHYTSQRICNIKLHMKTHRQKKPSECSLCDFSSTSSEALQQHMLKHCKIRTYACKFCPQSFNHKSTLRAHLRAHKDQEPFLCAYCVFETTNPLEYREHMLVHSGCSSRLRCPGCELILNNKEELTVHLLKCKGGAKKSKPLFSINERKLADKDVDKANSQISQNAVITTHECVVSGCSFTSPSILKLHDHLSVHCDPSLLVCNLCDFKALHSRSLKSHMKRHSNDQRYVQQPLEQYKCNLCGYVCHHLPSLKSHMWRHASDQSYSYEFTNDVINAAIDHDTRVEAEGEPDDPELLDRVINSERRILEGELSKCNKGDGQRPICWVTFRCCSCGFETINKAKLNIHMRAHSDIIQQALDLQRKSLSPKNAGKRLLLADNTAQLKVARTNEMV
ncbi:zinc finger protein 507 [Biomphalaria glabrata]|nr:zinc finger protein 507-like [Biomphalaria glabrata]